MTSPFVISSRVIETVKSLPDEERRIISSALAEELLCGEDPVKKMSPLQAMLYSVVRYYVKRDSERSSVRDALSSANTAVAF